MMRSLISYRKGIDWWYLGTGYILLERIFVPKRRVVVVVVVGGGGGSSSSISSSNISTIVETV